MWTLVMLVGTCAGVAEAAPASAAPPSGEVRDAVLLLDDSPLHLRFRLTLNGTALQRSRDEYVERLIKELDTNKDGKLSQEEAARSLLRPAPRRTRADAFLSSLPNSGKPVSLREMSLLVEKEGGELIVFRQDTSSSTTDGEVFKFLDVDGNGKLDRAEMLSAARRILERDTDQDECISFPEFIPPPPPPDPNQLTIVTEPPEPTGPVAKLSDLLRDVNAVPTPDAIISRYDRNRDKKLSPRELGWEPRRVTRLDRNKDGLLDKWELARIGETDVDLDLAVEMTGPGKNQPALRVLSTSGAPGEASKRPDYVRMSFDAAIVTIAFRQVDPIPAAIRKAMEQFNRLDTDANGYLERMEVADQVRFQETGENLFARIDLDGDGKIFGEEMEKYIRVVGEPVASTAVVNLYDTGRGFFSALDKNGDGRISMREMRASEQSLAAMKRTAGEGLKPTDPVRHFHLEFVRNSYTLFGAADSMISMTPSFEQRPMIGPVWFQRMDRNSDGDLTWNEFLGPREVFHRLDLDRDQLIDPTEAERASE